MATAIGKFREGQSEFAPGRDEQRGSEPCPPGWARTITRLTSGSVVTFALLMVAERIVDAPFVNGPFSGLMEMRADAAICFVATGAALLLATSRPSAAKQRTARVLAGAVIVIGALTLAEYLLDTPAAGVAPRGAMAPQTAIAFACLGLTLFLLNSAIGARSRLVPILTGTSFVIALVAVVGYSFGIPGLDGVAGTSTVALSTAITLLVLSVGIAAAAPTVVCSEVLTSDGPGGVVLRRMLPAFVVVCPIFGLLVFEGERHRFYSLANGLVFFGIVATVLLAFAVVSLAKRLNRLDSEHRHAAAKAVRLAALVDASNDAIMSSDAHGMITTCNPALEKLYGYTEAELVGQPVSVLTPPHGRAEQARLMQAAARGEVTSERDTQRLHKDGSLLDVSVTFSRIVHAGTLYGYCAVTHDITRRVRAHDQLQAAIRDRTHELSRSRAETLHSLALAAEYHDYETAEHTVRVGENAALLAGRLGMSASFVDLIHQAAPLHDVGKIGIPDHILLKPAALTPEEFDGMKEHTILGSRLLARSDNDVLKLGEVIALGHHERWDGKGYPAGLAGDAIPVAGRIVAVVDAFDAMTHDRPYKSACSIDEALAEISRGSGSQFDPRVAEAFLQLHRLNAAEHDVGRMHVVDLEPRRTTRPRRRRWALTAQ